MLVRRHVLAALASGIDAGHEDAARAAAARTEWLLRGRVRRRLERALIDGALAAGAPDTFHDPEAARHVQRVAALALVGQPVHVGDPARVAELYAHLPPAVAPRVRVGLIVAIVLALGVAGTAAGLALAHVTSEKPEGQVALVGPAPRVRDAYVRPQAPPVVGAFKDGGVPPGDPALEALFVGELTDLVIAIDRARDRGAEPPRERVAALKAAPAIAARGAGLTGAWATMLDTFEEWADTPSSDPDFDRLSRELRGRVRDVSDQLAAAGVGLYLESYVRQRGDRAGAVLYTYAVEEVVFVRVGGAPRRVLSLRRRDELNRSHALLGMQSDELGDPVLLVDKIDEHVASTLLPVLAPDGAYALGGWDPEVARAIGAAVRRELEAALGADAAKAREVGALIAERTALVDGWRATLKARGVRLARLEELYLPASLFESLQGDVPARELARARAIDERLATLEAARVADRVHGLLAASVRRHEAWHGADDERPAPLRYPAALEDAVGPELRDDGTPRRLVHRARAELSAYLAQLANDPATPQLSLWHVGRSVFDRAAWGTAESYAGVVILEGLARQLGVPAEQPVIHDGAIDRERLRAPALALAGASSERLREAARALWRELYDEPAVAITDR